MRLTRLALAFVAPAIEALPFFSRGATPALGQYALQKILYDASQVFGYYSNSQKGTATWMKKYADDTPIVRMNLPGTHDSQTWNYSQATQDRLAPLVTLNGEGTAPPSWYRCQEKPLITMLNDGIRVFDLRYAIDVTNTTLVFYHSQALQSEVSTLEDVLFGYYRWLDDHPSEAVFLSLMYEGSTGQYHANNAQVQTYLYHALTTAAARHYINQAKNTLGTLGQARGKITLFRRFDLNQLPASYEANLPGLHFSPNNWIDNGASFSITLNTQLNLTAYIEDFYMPYGGGIGPGATAGTISAKINATEANFQRAINATAAQHDDLFWSFASSTLLILQPPDTPMILALGNGTESTPKGGVNQQLLEFFKANKGTDKRLGISMFDFYNSPSDLVQSFLDIQCS